MKKIAVFAVTISALASFVCLSVNVDTKVVGGILGTVVLQPGTPTKNVEQTRAALRIAGIGWICIGILSFAWALRSSRR